MVVPTTQRQFYDTTKKVSGLAAYSGAIREGAEAWGKLIDSQQQARMSSLEVDVENEVKNEFARKSPEYDNDPDNAEFKQYMDDFRKQKYAEARDQINPFYRGQFDVKARENETRYNQAFDQWKIKQRQVNASNDVKKISQDMINTAYLAGQTGAYEDARNKYNEQVAAIRNVSINTLGARATEQGIEDLNKQYLVSFAQGSIDRDPSSMDEKLNDPKFIKEVGVDNVKKLKNYASGIKHLKNKAEAKQLISEFNTNPTKEAFDKIKNQKDVNVSAKALSEMEEIYKSSPNYVCETETEAITSIVDKIAEFSSNKYTVESGENKGAFDYEKQFNDAIELSHYIMMQNSKDGKLSQKDMQSYLSQVTKIMADDVTRRAMMNTKGEFMGFIDNVNEYINPIKSMGINKFTGRNQFRVVSSGDKAILDGIVQSTIGEAMARLSLGDEKGAKEILQSGNRDILDWKTPEIKGKKVGDTFIKDGRVYEIKGFDAKDFSVKLL